MKATHIPAPWEASTGDNDGRDLIIIEHEGFPICSVRGTDDMSCIHQDDEPRIAAEMVATARLICSAPELIEALEGFVKYWEWQIKDPHFEEYRQAKAAIKKARGL